MILAAATAAAATAVVAAKATTTTTRNASDHSNDRNGSFRKYGVPYLGVLTIRILLSGVLY